jgi:hypothetical protein
MPHHEYPWREFAFFQNVCGSNVTTVIADHDGIADGGEIRHAPGTEEFIGLKSA